MSKHVNGTLYFYKGEQLSLELQDEGVRCVFMVDHQAMAECQRDEDHASSKLLAIDTQGSVLHVAKEQAVQRQTYTAYGSNEKNGLLSLLGFNGERRDSTTECYLLGLGYRAYNPMLMRFNSPDSWSPFGAGGINAYGYCAGDPVSFKDPTGHMFRHNGNGRYTTPPIDLLEPSSAYMGKQNPSSDLSSSTQLKPFSTRLGTPKGIRASTVARYEEYRIEYGLGSKQVDIEKNFPKTIQEYDSFSTTENFRELQGSFFAHVVMRNPADWMPDLPHELKIRVRGAVSDNVRNAFKRRKIKNVWG